MTLQVSVLKPGVLVSLKTSVKGNVAYQRIDLEKDRETPGGGLRSKWETTRRIEDAAEFEAATQIRAKCRSVISATCCASSFGLLCPADKEQELETAIEEARRLAAEFNRDARLTRIEVYVMSGRIARDDVEAARAMAAELRDLMQDMQEGIAAADVERIREAANKARALGAMLSPDVAGKVSEAIDQARRAARELVKRVEKAGEAAADVVAELNTGKIEAARFAFLDLDDNKPIEHEAPAARGIELEPTTEPAMQPAPAEEQRALEF